MIAVERDFPDEPALRIAATGRSAHPIRFQLAPQRTSLTLRRVPPGNRSSTRERYCRSEDCFVDQLFAAAVMLGAPWMAAHFPTSLSRREPRALRARRQDVPRAATALRQRQLGARRRRAWHRSRVSSVRGRKSTRISCRSPRALEPNQHDLQALSRRCSGTCWQPRRTRFGYGVLVDCHSMPTGIRFPEERHAPRFHHR